jgi:hypothetical protein
MSNDENPSPDEHIPIPDLHYIAIGKVALLRQQVFELRVGPLERCRLRIRDVSRNILERKRLRLQPADSGRYAN